MIPDVAALYPVIEATWPAAAVTRAGPWTIRAGRGGGKRVSAATAAGPVVPGDLPAAEAAMRALDQAPLFMIRAGDEALDAILADAGYRIVDPVNIHVAPVGRLLQAPVPSATVFVIWEPLAIMHDIWAEGGIGPDRLAVMDRAVPPKTGLLGRLGHHPAAAGFVAMHEGIAMVHALEVRARHRRSGMAGRMMRQAAIWAAAQGGRHVAAVCTRANMAANALYSSIGMTCVGQYHYRHKPEAQT